MEQRVVGVAADRAALLNRLQEEHRALERRLAEIESHVGLTAEEQLERIQIKKLKLVKKDLILRQRQLILQDDPPPLAAR